MGTSNSLQQEEKADNIISLFNQLTVSKQIEVLEELKRINLKEIKNPKPGTNDLEVRL